ncbi:MAG TPA: molecular chaperone DnaK, partial [Propionibacteriaceae bacterium]|nr:molecular chaperone DnaK [Propionibacteriaceae bacterium]
DRMVKDAEAHAEDDRKRRETVEMRNEADGLAFRTEKLLADNAETLTEDVKAPVEEALTTLKEALAGDDNDAVKAAMDDLNTKAATMGQAVYAAAQAQQEAEASATGEATGDAGSDDDVVDAEIVDEDGKQQ